MRAFLVFYLNAVLPRLLENSHNMVNEIIWPWEGDVASELGRRLLCVAAYLQDLLIQLSPPLQATLQELLRQPGKLFDSGVAKGQPLSQANQNLWSLAVVQAHAAAADLEQINAPQETWHIVVPLAAAAEVLGMACDLSDDIQDGDSELVHRYSLTLVEPLTVVLFALLRKCLSDSRFPNAWLAPLHSFVTSAILEAAEAQFLDGWYERQSTITLDEVRQITEQKGAPLVRAVFQIGAFAGFAVSRPINEALIFSREFGRFGELIGILHQLRNDLRDSALESRKSDRIRGKKTLPLVIEQHVREQMHNDQMAVTAGRDGTMVAITIAQKNAQRQLQRIAERCKCPTDWLHWATV
jgi:geranylgeranyl pyrophosphate synthase